MAYPIYEAERTDWIREQEIGKAPEIKFAKFTSCIGVVAKVGNVLFGLHLSQFGVNRLIKDSKKRTDSSTPFSPAIAKEVRLQFPQTPDDVLIVGCVSSWADPCPQEYVDLYQIYQGYLTLKGLFDKMQNPYDIGPDGCWGARIQGDKIVPFRNNSPQMPYHSLDAW